MRIIAGDNKGMILKSPTGDRVRPTADKVKGALFSILGSRIIDARALDLFAGTGNLGVEALSRGAQSVVFVDAHRESIACIRNNITKAQQISKAKVMQQDCLHAIKQLAATGCEFDIIFCDPPYNQGWLLKICSCVFEYNVLADSGVLIIEHAVDELCQEQPNARLIQSRKYGGTMISFFER